MSSLPLSKLIPKLGFIVTVYNKRPYIAQCLRSIMEQQEKDIEIIVVDDHSTDGSFEIVEKLAQEDPRIRLTRNPKHTGHPSSGRNWGIDNAHSDFISFIDADDYLYDNMVATRLLDIMHKPQVDVAIAGKTSYDGLMKKMIPYDKKNEIAKHSNLEDHTLIFHHSEVAPLFFQDFYPGICLLVFRRAFLRKHQLYFEEVLAEDLPYTLTAYFHARKIGYIPHLCYVINKNTIHSVNRDNNHKLQYAEDVLNSLIKVWRQNAELKKDIKDAFLSVVIQQVGRMLNEYIKWYDITLYISKVLAFLKEMGVVPIPSNKQLDALPKYRYMDEQHILFLDIILSSRPNKGILSLAPIISYEKIYTMPIKHFLKWHFLARIGHKQYEHLSRRKRYLAYFTSAFRVFILGKKR